MGCNICVKGNVIMKCPVYPIYYVLIKMIKHSVTANEEHKTKTQGSKNDPESPGQSLNPARP
jgi:hypothetical protein